MFILIGLKIQNQIQNTDGLNQYQIHSTGPFLRDHESLNDCMNRYKRQTLRTGKSQTHSKFINLLVFLHLSSSQGERKKGWFYNVMSALFQQMQWTVFYSCKATASKGCICTNVLLCSQHCTRSYIVRTQTQYLFNHCNTLLFYSVIFQYAHTGV